MRGARGVRGTRREGAGAAGRSVRVLGQRGRGGGAQRGVAAGAAAGRRQEAPRARLRARRAHRVFTRPPG